MTVVLRLFLFLKITRFIRRAFAQQPTIEIASCDVPKDIYIYWHQGIDSAPELCKKCIQSWRDKNPNWQVHVLDAEDAGQILSDINVPKNLTLASYSDLLRLVLLQKYGGVWIDSTVLCIRPLDDWLPVIMNQTDFFCFSNPSRDRVIASWFLAAKKNSVTVDVWANSACDYLSQLNDPPKAYFWMHYLYQYLSITSKLFKRSTFQMPNISAQPQHLIQNILHGIEPKEYLNIARQSPMQKLSYKHKYSIDEVETALCEHSLAK